MRILYVSATVPHPLHNGGQIRIHHLLSGLVAEHEVTFLSLLGWRGSRFGLSEPDEYLEGWPLADRFSGPPIVVPYVPADGQHAERLSRRAPLVPWWAQPHGFDSNRISVYFADAVEEKLADLPLDEYDVVQVTNMHLAPWVLSLRPRCPRARFVLDMHDIWSTYVAREQLLAQSSWLGRWRWIAEWRVAKTKLFERWLLPQFDLGWVCSEHECRHAERWMGPGRVAVVPNGVDVAYYADILPEAPDPAPRLVYVGDYSYYPNQEAALHFCERILPRVRERVPDVTFSMVGKNPPDFVRRLADADGRIRVTGRVPDVRPYLQESHAVVTPLLTGAGTRLKILEAMAAGRPVVSTPVGAEGLEATPGREIFIEDDPEHFAERCVALLVDPTLRRRMAEAARRLVSDRYDWPVIYRRALETYERFVSPAPATASY